MNIARRQILKFAGVGVAAPVVSRIARARSLAGQTDSGGRADPGRHRGRYRVAIGIERARNAFGQPIVIDNRPGATGTIGAAVVAKADPDGCTILIAGSSHTIVPAMYSRLSYDPVRDFTPIVPLASMPFALAVAPSKGIKTIKDLVIAAKAEPGSLSYASGGVGSTNHLATERLRLSAGFDALHVPYRGAGFSADLLSGRIDFAYVAIGNNLEFFMDGRLLAFAVSSQKRTSSLPATHHASWPARKNGDSGWPLWPPGIWKIARR